MFLTERKLDRRIAEIREYCYREIRHLEEFAVCEDHQGVVNPEVPVEFEGWEKMRTGERWSGRDRYLWLHKEITIPESLSVLPSVCGQVWKGEEYPEYRSTGSTGQIWDIWMKRQMIFIT